ncbi:hypothetical protein ACFSOZ_27770 [Mesorhizobium newzealandense]|uniref:DUF4238 domain-containing protein n=1 Tax=Mesorhizobium newzealandense TaxID=1300302 RepID=A0ABW4UKR7_9HYPH
MEIAKLSELKKLRHLNVEALNGRAINMMALWEDGSWHLWFPTADGTLMEMHPVDAAHSVYWGKSAARDEDVRFSLFEILWQRASFPDVVPLIHAIADDFHLMAASAAKLEHFHAHAKDTEGTLVSSFVRSELEYILIVARSVFDLTQEALSRCWNNHMVSLDPEAEAIRRRHPLPASFAKVLYRAKVARTSANLVADYALPPSLAQTYLDYEPFFSRLRELRDGIIHGISRNNGIFVTEKGFCVVPTMRPFSDFPWKAEHHFNESIVSLKPWIAHIVSGTIDACSALLFSLANSTQLPGDIAEGYRVFLRDPANGALLRLLEAETGDQVWWSRTTESLQPTTNP